MPRQIRRETLAKPRTYFKVTSLAVFRQTAANGAPEEDEFAILDLS